MNKKGFAAMFIILGVIVVLIIGGGYVYENSLLDFNSNAEIVKVKIGQPCLMNPSEEHFALREAWCDASCKIRDMSSVDYDCINNRVTCNCRERNEEEQAAYEENIRAIERSREAREDGLSVWRENKPSQEEVLSCIKTKFMDENNRCEATTNTIKNNCNILEFDLTDSDNYGNNYYIYGTTDNNIIITEGMGGNGVSIFLGKDHNSLGNTIYCK